MGSKSKSYNCNDAARKKSQSTRQRGTLMAESKFDNDDYSEERAIESFVSGSAPASASPVT